MSFSCPVCRSNHFGTGIGDVHNKSTWTGYCHGKPRGVPCKFTWNREKEDRLVGFTEPVGPLSIDMVLHCPQCMAQHIDGPDARHYENYHPGGLTLWTNPPHRSHLCAKCGHIWRPADVPTNGVAAVKTRGRDDS